MGALVPAAPERAPTPRTIAFAFLGRGRHKGQAGPWTYSIEPVAKPRLDPRGFPTRPRVTFTATVRRNGLLQASLADLRTVSGAKAWCQHWHALAAAGMKGGA